LTTEQGSPPDAEDMSPDDPGRALTRFYVHLVTMTCVQLAVVVVALAQRAVPLWCAAALVAGALSLAGHGALALAPRLRTLR
jgi:hypothetical protein